MSNEPHGVRPDEWVDRYGDVLYRYALSRLQNSAAAEDAVQETFLAAIKSRDRFAGASSEQTWLIGILKHKIVDYMRRESRERPREDLDAPDALDDICFDTKGRWRLEIGDWQVNPRQLLERGEFMEALRGCLAHLPNRLGSVFTLREMEDMSTAEICKLMELSPTNLWVSLHRARMRLRKCLEENWFGTSKGKKH